MFMDIIQFIEGLNRAKQQRKSKFTFCLSWDIHLLLLSDISVLGSWILRLGPGVTPVAPWFSGIWTWTYYTTGFPYFPARRWWIMELLGFNFLTSTWLGITHYQRPFSETHPVNLSIKVSIKPFLWYFIFFYISSNWVKSTQDHPPFEIRLIWNPLISKLIMVNSKSTY